MSKADPLKSLLLHSPLHVYANDFQNLDIFPPISLLNGFLGVSDECTDTDTVTELNDSFEALTLDESLLQNLKILKIPDSLQLLDSADLIYYPQQCALEDEDFEETLEVTELIVQACLENYKQTAHDRITNDQQKENRYSLSKEMKASLQQLEASKTKTRTPILKISNRPNLPSSSTPNTENLPIKSLNKQLIIPIQIPENTMDLKSIPISMPIQEISQESSIPGREDIDYKALNNRLNALNEDINDKSTLANRFQALIAEILKAKDFNGSEMVHVPFFIFLNTSGSNNADDMIAIFDNNTLRVLNKIFMQLMDLESLGLIGESVLKNFSLLIHESLTNLVSEESIDLITGNFSENVNFTINGLAICQAYFSLLCRPNWNTEEYLPSYQMFFSGPRIIDALIFVKEVLFCLAQGYFIDPEGLKICEDHVRKIFDLSRHENILNALSEDQYIKSLYLVLELYFLEYKEFGDIKSVSTIWLNNIRLGIMMFIAEMYTRAKDEDRRWILNEVLSMTLKSASSVLGIKQTLLNGENIRLYTTLLLLLSQSCANNLSKIKPTKEENQKMDEASLMMFAEKAKSIRTSVELSVDIIEDFMFRWTDTKSPLLSEQRELYDAFFEDLILLSFKPQWPIIPLLLQNFAIRLLSVLSQENFESNIKLHALDGLGKITVKVLQVKGHCESLNLQLSTSEKIIHISDLPCLTGKDVIVSKKQLENLRDCYWQVLSIHVKHALSGDMQLRHSMYYLIFSWHQDLSRYLERKKDELPKNIQKIIYDLLNWLQDFSIIEQPGNAEFQVSEDAFSLLSYGGPLLRASLSLVNGVILSLNSNFATLRSKAIRIFGLVLEQSTSLSLLDQSAVRKTIQSRLNDQSPSVRDATMDLLGKHALNDPKVLKAYYKFIIERLSDVSVNVRKRVIKLLLQIYHQTDDRHIQVDILICLYDRLRDIDVTVQKNAVNALSELLFSPFIFSHTIEKEGLNLSSLNAVEKQRVISRTRIFLESASLLQNNSGLISLVFEKQIEFDATLYTMRLIVEAVFEVFLEAEENNDQALSLTCLITLTQLATVMSGCLVKYLSQVRIFISKFSKEIGCIKSEEKLIALLELLYALCLKQDVLAYLKHNNAIMPQLEQDLFKLLTGNSHQAVMLAVPLLCLLSSNSSFISARISKLHKTCFEKVKMQSENLNNSTNNEWGNIHRTLLIFGLLCRYTGEDLSLQFDWDELFEVVIRFTLKTLPLEVQCQATQTAGMLFVKDPALLITERVNKFIAEKFQAIYSENSLILQEELIKAFITMLDQNSVLVVAQPVSIAEFNNEQADDDINSSFIGAVIQHNLKHILQLTLYAPLLSCRKTALQLFECIVDQGLVHPLHCIPTLTALEASTDETIRTKAGALHEILASKYDSFIHSKNNQAIEECYRYCRHYGLEGWYKEPGGGGMARLNILFKIVQIRKSRKDQFLSLLPQMMLGRELEFCKFIMENLLTLSYKKAEDLTLMIKSLEMVITKLDSINVPVLILKTLIMMLTLKRILFSAYSMSTRKSSNKQTWEVAMVGKEYLKEWSERTRLINEMTNEEGLEEMYQDLLGQDRPIRESEDSSSGETDMTILTRKEKRAGFGIIDLRKKVRLS